VLDDLLKHGLKLVVCGTAAGARSAELKQYYAGPGDKFWRTLFELGLTPRQLAPGEAELLLDLDDAHQRRDRDVMRPDARSLRSPC
jgi:TDG/mug DNA glycosylase family protein